RVVSINCYWLPRKPSTYDWSTESEKKHPYYTGVTSYEDLTMLNQLRKDHLAFQIHLSIVEEKSGEEILPVLWEDNYFSLMPGESREIAARYEMPLSV